MFKISIISIIFIISKIYRYIYSKDIMYSKDIFRDFLIVSRTTANDVGH